MKKIVTRSEFDRYESAIDELKAIGNDKEHWLRSEPRSELWFHQIVCALKHNRVTTHMFTVLDAKPGKWGGKYSSWHWKLRSCRNHPQWSQTLFEALRKNDEIVANGASHE